MAIDWEAFRRECVARWPESDLDGFNLQELAVKHGLSLQELAVKHGLLRKELYDPEKHGECEYGSEPDDQ